MLPLKSITRSKTLFLDFDGVIKDSVDLKGVAFEQLFLAQGKKVCERIRAHHESNGGMSRNEKLPIYLDWAGLTTQHNTLEEYSSKFSKLVKQKVIDCEWVSGIETFLHTNPFSQNFFIITATPQSEIDQIVDALGLRSCFTEVIGAPINKKDAIYKLIERYDIDKKLSVMIGDSISDYEAAIENRIDFILRKTKFNQSLQNRLKCPMIKDFLYLNKELSDG